MNLLVFTHKQVWCDKNEKKFYTNGGFSTQITAISELFNQTKIICPISEEKVPSGTVAFPTDNIFFIELLNQIKKTGFNRKIFVTLWWLKNIKQIKKEINSVDAIHIPLMSDIGLLGLITCLLMKKKLFVRYCGNWYKNENFIEYLVKKIMSITAGRENIMFATGGGYKNPIENNKNIKWIFSTSLNSQQISEHNKLRSLRHDSILKIFVAGRQTKAKGTHHVIKAISILRENHNIKLFIAGNGPDLKFFKLYSKQLGLGPEHINFLGQLNSQEIHEYYEKSDIFCFPSVSSEGFPKVVVEAITHGLPVLASSVSVLPHLFRNGGGIILDIPFSNSIVQNIENFILDKDSYEKISKEAVELSKKYSIEHWKEIIWRNIKKNWL